MGILTHLRPPCICNAKVMSMSICDAIVASISLSALKMLIFKSYALQMQMDGGSFQSASQRVSDEP